MYTLNHQYIDKPTLIGWLNEHSLAKQKECLVQFFCGQPQKDTMKHIASLLTKQLPLAHVVGTTTDGEIIDESVLTESIIISCSVFEKSTLRTACITDRADSYALGAEICTLLDGDDVKALIVFTTGSGDIDGEQFLHGVRSVSQGNYLIAGGMAGDNGRFIHTYVSHQNTLCETGAVAVALCGSKLRVASRYQLGWKAVGLPMKVTKAVQNRIYEIEGRSTVSIYEKYFGKEIADQLPKIGIELPLIITRNGVDMARACLKRCDDGSLIFAGDIATGEMVRFGIGDVDMILNESKRLCQESNSSFSPESLFVYSCMARRRLLQDSNSLEIKRLSRQCTVSGFYTYGEFFSDQNGTYLMNETITLLAVSESDKTHTPNAEDTHFEEPVPLSGNLLVRALTYMGNVVAEEWEARLNQEIEKNREAEMISFQNAKLIQMGELVSMIAHQWRQPLNALSATAINMSLLSSMGKLEPAYVQESSRFIQNQCQKMSHTIDTFINFVKPAKESQIFRLNHTIEALMHIIGSQLSNHNIEIILHQLDDTVWAEGYEDLLEQVLLNLLSNAKDAFDGKEIKEKQIQITVYAKEGVSRIIVEDNAGGIPSEAQEKIFNPYFTTKEQGKGTGIGLYMSLNIMRKSFNGDLIYHPTSQGSRFEIIFEEPKDK